MTQTVTYEAEQARPTRHLGIPCHHRVFKEFASFDAAVSYARRILGQRPGAPVEIWRKIEDPKHRNHSRIATVRRDASDRTWTDIEIWGEV